MCMHKVRPMKRLAILVGALLAAGSFATTFGAPVISRGNVDFAHEITFIGTAHAAPISGYITSWSLYAGEIDSVALQMWRPVAGGYTLVGENTVTATTLGANTFNIASANRIAVQAGDVLGFRYRQTTFARRVIEMTFGGGAYAWTNWPSPVGEVPIGGFLANGSLVGQWENREYSLAANVEPVPEPLTLVTLAGALLALRARRR